jgi:probable phosphoglycerate mutase
MQNSTTLSKKTIYLIRHGQTDFNKQGIVQGSGVDSSLNDEGHAQARKFFEAYHHINFDKIYVTELQRTHQTVAPFGQKNIPIEIVPEFNEINWGIFEGKLPTPENTKTFLQILQRWRSGELDHCIENGETPLAMFERQSNGLSRILKNETEETILICMHGRAMRSFLCLLTGTTLQNMDNFDHANVCLYKLEQKEDNTFEIILNNYTEHLI